MTRLNEDIIIDLLDEADKLDINARDAFIRDTLIGRKAVYIHTYDGEETVYSLEHDVIKDIRLDYYNFIVSFRNNRTKRLTDLIYLDIGRKDFLKGVDDILEIVSDSKYRNFDEFITQNQVSLDIMHRVFDDIVMYGESRESRGVSARRRDRSRSPRSVFDDITMFGESRGVVVRSRKRRSRRNRKTRMNRR